MPPNGPAAVVPAHLAFLAIYNPSLGATDETLHNQIVYYYSKSSRARASRRGQPRSGNAGEESKHEDENERLRQIGLAQGMRIDLTRLTSETPISTASLKSASASTPWVEYSSREVSPPYLLLQQLHRAHSIFLLHHARSLDSLYSDLPRERFFDILDRFWTRFVLNWDILLHGNPAVDILNGIKLFGNGELGIGVGEEEWGSGEREVLEGFISRTEGLVDMILSRFGDPVTLSETEITANKQTSNADLISDKHSWLGCGTCPSTSDGVLFSGIGKIAPSSLASVSQWMEWIYRYGEGAYGIREDPRSERRRKKRRNFSSVSGVRSQGSELKSHPRSKSVSENHVSRRSLSPGIPPPLVVSPDSLSTKSEPGQHSIERAKSPEASSGSPLSGTDTFMKMITLGYGSIWGGSSNNPLTHPRVNMLRFGMHDTSDRDTSPSDAPSTERGGLRPQMNESSGRFIIGLRDDLENEDSDEDENNNEEDKGRSNKTRQNQRPAGVREVHISSRTLDVNVVESGTNVSKRVRVVVYLHQPFMFAFLLEPETPSLSSPSFYRSIHHQIGPLQKPLLSSTCPSKASQRLANCSSYHSFKNNEAPPEQIYDVVSDPSNGTIRASLPNIPEPGAPPSGPNSWSRLDALNVHTQIINTLIETRHRPSEIERTCKTNRGWWVLWMRLRDSATRPHSRHVQDSSDDARKSAPSSPKIALREAFLVRRSSDYVAAGQGSRKGFFQSISGSSGDTQGGWTAPGKLAEGIGFDAKRYIEALLSLNQ
ncbi:hypothetical protein PRK78_000870 [Emydomyces testavorans]|uniref:CCZ1/INTU/HSP4 first Longin domain-containing protein n=1 Tax=Emydomyces testavorans TaxID=2070801 RepID=A0AAF0II25_9EURO|nr:hypothetical protein PRK78_000870 [Emydomyces testavorans]